MLFLRESRGFPLPPGFPSFSPSAMPSNFCKHPPEPPSSQFSSSHLSHRTQPPFIPQQASSHKNDRDDKQPEDYGKNGNGPENAGEYVNESTNLQGSNSCNANNTTRKDENHLV